jgi:HEAT repeat protein
LLLRALHTAARLKLKNVAPKILSMLQREQSEKLSVACCEYFQHVPSAIALELLMKIPLAKKGFLGMHYEYSEDIRAAAVLALGAFHTPEVLEVIKKAKEDKGASVRAAARHILEGPSETKP